jgi:hypothetical protein
MRFAEHDNVEVSVPPTFRKSAIERSTRAAAELRSAWTREGARPPHARPQPIAASRVSPRNSLKEQAEKRRKGHCGGGAAVRIGRTVLILLCSLFVSGCVNHGKKLHKRADRDVPRSNGSPVVQVACAVPPSVPTRMTAVRDPARSFAIAARRGRRGSGGHRP